MKGENTISHRDHTRQDPLRVKRIRKRKYCQAVCDPYLIDADRDKTESKLRQYSDVIYL
jgi:hypothetical protein